ncbi:MAG: UDP-N-acetylglucosamine 2-epimerase [Chthoniobacter sp.]|uniref:UDP-N-acetylglucosamine 2-epimerase n=1 Tax=Chthoniobacter sp. TaxID=2510640 RepID=UPI0032A90E35
MGKRRSIHFFSAARSDYDLIAPVIGELRSRQQVDVGVIAGSAQLSPFHGGAIRQIEEDGVPIVGRLETLLASESWVGRSLSFAHLAEALTRQLATNRPDILFVAGDREEHLAAAVVANCLRLHVAHLHGGDRCIASELDEVMRAPISKLSHLHFPASESHRERLIRMGEDPAYIWACGAPGLDRLRTTPDVPSPQLAAEFGFDPDQPFFLIIQHPSTMFEKSGHDEQEMTALLEGVLALGHPVLCSYPNIDPGNVGIRTAIDRVRAQNERLHVYHNLARDRFVALYRRCSAIIGNSSSLVIESGYLKKPAILVGPRQDLRDRGQNVMRVDFTKDEIAAACRRVFEDREYLAAVHAGISPYGDGHASPRIADILTTIELKHELLLKMMPY